MNKIYRIRHMEYMIVLAKRTKRTMCYTKEEHARVDEHIANYEKLLKLVQDN